MSYNLDEIRKIINYITNKDQVGNTFTIPQFNLSLKTSNINLFTRYLGLEEQYLQNLPTAKRMVEVAQRITDDLKPFKVSMNGITTPYLSVDSNGFALYPSDYKYPLSMAVVSPVVNECETDYTLPVVDFLTDAQFVERRNNMLMAPDMECPVCNEQSGYIRFLPKNVQYAEFHYLRLPVTPIFDYYINAYGEEIYLAAGITHQLLTGEVGSSNEAAPAIVTSKTVEHEWNEMAVQQLVNIMLAGVGINLREGQLSQYAQMIKQQGS